MLNVAFNAKCLSSSCTAEQFRKLFFYGQLGQWVPVQDDLIKLTLIAILQPKTVINSINHHTEKYAPLSPEDSQKFSQLLSRFLTAFDVSSLSSDEKTIESINVLTQRSLIINAKTEMYEKICFRLNTPNDNPSLIIALKIENFGAQILEGLTDKNKQQIKTSLDGFAAKYDKTRNCAFKNMLLLTCASGDAQGLKDLLASSHKDDLLASVTSAELTYLLLTTDRSIPPMHLSEQDYPNTIALLLQHGLIKPDEKNTQSILSQLNTLEHSKWFFQKNYRYKSMLTIFKTECQKFDPTYAEPLYMLDRKPSRCTIS